MAEKYWDFAAVLARSKTTATRDWEYLHEIRDFTRLERNVVISCRDWFGIKNEELFNLFVDHVLAEAFDQSEHSTLSVEDIDVIVLTIGNVLTSRLLKSGRNWFKIAYESES